MRKVFSAAVMLLLISALAACGSVEPETTPAVEEAEENKVAPQAPADTSVESEEAEPAEEAFQPAVDFTMTDWQGNEVSLSDYKGKIVFLNFFATWCPPCEKEMPEFQQAYEDYEGDVVFLIVDVYTSERGSSVEDVKQWYTDGGYTMPMIIDETGELNQYYPVRAFPTTFIINREGNVLGYLEGAMERELVDQVIEQVDQ